MEQPVVDPSDSIWVFGYGSLTWKPDISYISKRFGYISGFKRRFWQSNTTHRGTVEQPGRVATLVKDDTAVLWGVAYELSGEEQILAAMKSLNTREKDLGGYITVVKQFIVRGNSSKSLSVLVYTGTPNSDLYVGPAESMDQLAQQIVRSRGAAGPNSEYVTKLAEFARKYTPEEKDEHLFALDKKIRKLMSEARFISSTEEVNNTVICKTIVEHKTKKFNSVKNSTNTVLDIDGSDTPICMSTERKSDDQSVSDLEEAIDTSLIYTKLPSDRDD